MEIHKNSKASKEAFITGTRFETLIEASTQNGTRSNQAAEPRHEKESQKSSIFVANRKYDRKLCNTIVGLEYFPCLDNG